MEFHHQRLIFGADGTDERVSAVLQSPARDVLTGVRADGEPGQLLFGGSGRVEDHAGVKRNQFLR